MWSNIFGSTNRSDNKNTNKKDTNKSADSTSCSAQSVFLIGPMGAGKTTIAKKLADRLQRDCYDSDHVIENRTGVDIPYIFEREGEAGFRKRERETIDELTQMPGIVLATGGGAVLNESNRKNLRSRGFVVFLDAPVSVQMARTAGDKRRPLLQVDNPEENLQKLYDSRLPLYRATADLVLSTAEGNPHKLVDIICKELKR